MIDKNDFGAIDITRNVDRDSSDDNVFDEKSFLKGLERSETNDDRAMIEKLNEEYDKEMVDLYGEQDYSLEEYMKLDPGVELAGISQHEETEKNRQRIMDEVLSEKESEPVEEKEDPLADAPWENDPVDDEYFDDMYRSHILRQAESYGICNIDDVEFEKLEEAIDHLDSLYREGRISMPVKVNGSLIVNDKGEVVVSGVSNSSDWASTTNLMSDAVKNRNYDLLLND